MKYNFLIYYMEVSLLVFGLRAKSKRILRDMEHINFTVVHICCFSVQFNVSDI